MKLIIFGYYNHSNFGDDCFVLSFQKIFNGHDLQFENIASIGDFDLNNYHCVIVGAGDVLNDFYGIKYEEALAGYSGYKIAVCVGASFEECIFRKYINYFDDIILRSKADLSAMVKVVGSKHIHYMPDLAYVLDVPETQSEENGKNVGIYLVGTMLKNMSLMFSLLRFIRWLLSNGYHIHLIPMGTDPAFEMNDLDINFSILESLHLYRDGITTYDKLDYDEFTRITSKMNYAMCVRFHSHVFCLRQIVPFISIPYTRKVDIFMDDLPLDVQNSVKVFGKNKYQIVGIDVPDAKRKFLNIVNNRKKIVDYMRYKVGVDNTSYEYNKILTLVTNRNKRRVVPAGTILINPKNIYNKYRHLLLSKGINNLTDKCQDFMTDKEIDLLAAQICYDITLNTNNEYEWGTKINVRVRLDEMKIMIDYIYNDFQAKARYPKINLTFIDQNSSKGLHRAGWEYSIAPLYSNSGDHGALFDIYLDRTFGWSSDLLASAGIIPYTNYWCGFFHHTFETEFAVNNCKAVFTNPLFIASLPLCKGIFCLSKYLAGQVRKALDDLGFGYIRVTNLLHPTVFVDNIFNFDNFMENESRRIVNVGGWYRNPVTIHRIAEFVDNSFITCHSLKGKRMEGSFCPEKIKVKIDNDHLVVIDDNYWSRYYIKYINGRSDDYAENMYTKIKGIISDSEEDQVDILNYEGENLIEDFLSRINVIPTLNNQEYDNLFCKNIIFLDLVDASVANTLLEVIVRKTPILIRRIPPVEEMLGSDYPLLFDQVEEAESLLTPDNILAAHKYLCTMEDYMYRIDHFIDLLTSSEIYKSL